MPLQRALVGFVAVGCLFLLLEVLIEHREVLGEHLIAWAPVVFSGLTMLACLWAFARWQPQAMKAVQVASVLLLLVGIAGLYFHNAARLGIGRETEEAGEAEENRAPPLASLALTGMGILGLMATYQKWQQR